MGWSVCSLQGQPHFRIEVVLHFGLFFLTRAWEEGEIYMIFFSTREAALRQEFMYTHITLLYRNMSNQNVGITL